MNRYKKPIKLEEGKAKKGGLNVRPSFPKPQVIPVGQKQIVIVEAKRNE